MKGQHEGIELPIARWPQLLDAGEAWQELGDVTGHVVATFRRACYVRLGDGLLAMGGPVPAGPLHLRIADPHWATMRAVLQVGDRVNLRDDRLAVSRWTLDLSAAAAWHPPPVDSDRLLSQGSLARAIIARDDLVACCGIEAGDIEAVSKSLEVADLHDVATRLGGRGPGLTPAGDDFLAGALVVDATLRPEWERSREAVAAAVGTTAISLAFLSWAARGRSIDPLHRLLVGVAAGCPLRSGEAIASLRRIGDTSGKALALGALTRVRAASGLS